MSRLAADMDRLDAYGLAFRAQQQSVAQRAADYVGGAAVKVGSAAPGNANVVSDTVGGDILRGRGPHRGGLGKLLKYWRPIMKRPGGWRRCVLELADHPELGNIKALCAWLHHETTGKWPGEGHGKRNRHIVGGALKKDARGSDDFESSDRRLRLHVGRAAGSVAFAPLDGSVGQADYKALWFREAYNVKTDAKPKKGPKLIKIPKIGSGAQGRVGGAFLLDAVQDEGWKPNPVRSGIGKLRFGAAAQALRLGHAIGIDKSRVTRVSKFVRCPAGTVRGGTYTQRNNQQCGGKVVDSADGDLKKVGKASNEAQRAAVHGLRKANSGKPLIVRSDGQKMKPAVSLDKIGKLKQGHPDMKGSVLSVKGHIKGGDLAAFGSGIKRIDSPFGKLEATRKISTAEITRIRREATKIHGKTPDEEFIAQVAKISKGALKYSGHKPKAA